MADTNEAGKDIISTGLKHLLSSPTIAVALFIMWLCGVVLSFAYIDNNDSFKNRDNQKSLLFNLALGFMPGSIVMLIYHAVTRKEMLSTLEGFEYSALPSSLILSGITCLLLIYRIVRS